MDVTVIRHGSAQDRAATDAERALTDRGRAEVAAAGDRLATLGSAPDSIISSPLLRARQTAEVVARRLGFAGPIEIDEALVPDAPPAGVRTLLDGLGARRHVVLVAHEPLLSAACALLTGTTVGGLHKAEIVSMTTDAATVAPAPSHAPSHAPPHAMTGATPARFAIRFRA